MGSSLSSGRCGSAQAKLVGLDLVAEGAWKRKRRDSCLLADGVAVVSHIAGESSNALADAL